MSLFLPERLRAAGLDTRSWIHDHNYLGRKRVKYILSDPLVRKNIAAVAWQPYSGSPEMIQEIRREDPDLKADFQLTDKGPNLRKESAESCALDENGTPDLGRFDCAGLVGVHSRTGEIFPGVQYHAFKPQGIQFKYQDQYLRVMLRPESMVTICF